MLADLDSRFSTRTEDLTNLVHRSICDIEPRWKKKRTKMFIVHQQKY